MPEIAGYTDMQYIKGQYYRLAAAPKPVVYTGNIDTISEELLTKAMFVSKVQASGTFPNDFGTNFLITTVKYGNNTYLQTAYMGPESGGFESWEYRRIYSNGEWTEWIGTDSYITDVDRKISEVKEETDSCSAEVDALGRQMSSVSSSVNGLNNSVGNLAGQISTVSSRVSSLESKTSSLGSNQLWEGTLRSGSITFTDSYTVYLVVGMVLNNGSRTSILHPRKQITTTSIKYLLADNDEWVRYSLKDNGNHQLSLTFEGKSASYQGGGAILQVWGIN